MPLTGLINILASYLPPTVARAIQADPRPPDAPTIETFPAAVLFADVSGFTALSERLARQGTVGAEELSELLNRYFNRMIGLLEAEGGEVVQFSGDALTAVFVAGNDLPVAVRLAVQTAQRMQAAMPEFGRFPTSVGELALGMKIAIGVGDVLGLSLGGVDGRWHYLIAGDPLRQVAEAEHAATRGELRLSPEAAALHDGQFAPPSPLLPTLWHAPTSATLNALRAYIPETITARLLAGQDDWLAELRRLSIVFFSVGGIDYNAPTALEQTQACVAAVQRVAARYEGSLNKLLVDDKGTVGIILFGAPPLSHEDDPLRAVRCALDLQEAFEELGLRLSVGVTTGQVFAGPVGSTTRREYTVVGDAVNLAARLMQLAGHGRVLCDHATYHAAGGAVRWLPLPPQTVKGKAAAVVVYRPLGLQQQRRTVDSRRPLIGREAERTRLVGALDQLAQGRLQAICIEGDSGIGKGRLLAEVDRVADERGIAMLVGIGQSVEQQTPYRAWREVFARYLGISEGNVVHQREHALARLSEVAPHLLERAPLLNDVLGLGLPENELTSNFEPKLRQASLFALLSDLLLISTREQPLVISLEDAHWLDSLSWQLALQVTRSLADVPLLLLVSLRPFDELPLEHPYAALRELGLMQLGLLSGRETIAIAADTLGVGTLPPAIATLIERRAAGHPFVAEELALALRDSGAISVVDGECIVHRQPDTLDLPETVQGIVLSRIDRLPASEQLTIKVASVIGRSFGYEALYDVYPASIEELQLRGQMDSLVRRDLLLPPEEYAALSSYSFKQTLTQEVTYSTLLHTQRRELHAQVARWYEQHTPETQPDRSLLLAYHWRHAHEPSRERYFAALAGKKLAADYANAEAISYLNRALELTDDDEERYDLLLQLLQVHERIGDRAAQRANLEQLQVVASRTNDVRRQAQVANAWATLYRDLSDYPAAIQALERAQQLAQQIDDAAAQARNLTLWGQVMEYQGSYVDARGYYEQALSIYRQIGYQRGEANNLSNLGNIHFYTSEYELARRYDLEALTIRRDIGDKVGEAASLINLGQSSSELGDFASSKTYQQKALSIARVIGDRNGELLSLAAIGYSCLLEGDYQIARMHIENAIRLARLLDDRRTEGNNLTHLGMVWRDVGNQEQAYQCFHKALVIFNKIGEVGFAAYTHLNLGYVLLDSDPAAALEHFEQALADARATDNQDAEAYGHGYRALYHEQQRHWGAARADYEVALAICAEIDADAIAVEQRAGLARVALAQGNVEAARAYAQHCFEHLETKGIVGIEFPLLVYLTCHDVLVATGETEAARQLVEIAHGLLMGRANAIGDEAMRGSLLENVATNRRVQELWAGYQM
jgi:class 3 adenylate cyclase/predicted ATPase